MSDPKNQSAGSNFRAAGCPRACYKTLDLAGATDEEDVRRISIAVCAHDWREAYASEPFYSRKQQTCKGASRTDLVCPSKED